MRQAIALARHHMDAGHGGPFGAVVVRDDKVIAEGWNRVLDGNDPTAHAEIVAIRRACEAVGHFSLEGCVLYTSCEPCPMCLAAIYWARLDGVVYAGTRDDAADAGFDDAFLYRELPLDPDQRTLTMTSMLRNEASSVFQAWIEKPDKIPY